jgi:hypothetical protein
MSAIPRPPVGRTNTSVQQAPKSIPWIWDGILADSAVTLLSAPEKTGKTTLLSLLLDRRRAGGELLGRTVYPGKTVVCTEERYQLWNLRQPPLDFGPDLTFLHPNGDNPTRRHWNRTVNDVCEVLEREEGFDLLVIDTAVSFLPLADRNKRNLQWSIGQLGFLTKLPTTVLVLNQSRTVHRPLAAYADIVIEMKIPRNEGPTRRRTITGVGRYPETLQKANAELNAAGTDYVLLPDTPAPHPPVLTTLQKLLSESPDPLTHRELLARRPGPPPHEGSLWRTIGRGVEMGLFTVEGKGTKTEPFRFGWVGKVAEAEIATE